MTIAIVLKPDFTATFSRGVLRLAGTFTGLLLSTALFHWMNPTSQTQVLLIAAWVFTLRYLGPANYGILVTAVTAFVVLLIGLTGVAPQDVMTPRGLNTAAGGCIALLAYWIWPTWEHRLVLEMLAKMLDAYRAYFRAVRDSYIHPETSLSAELDRTRVAARLARSNLEASVDRLHSEPRTPPETLALLSTILANSHRLVHAMMALEAGLQRSRPAPVRDSFRTFADHAELTLYYLAAALRGSPLTLSQLPDLREDHHALLQSGDPHTERYALVNVETDRVTNSINSLSEEILQLKDPVRSRSSA